jgi:DNA-binding transcriptional LysR family regulator
MHRRHAKKNIPIELLRALVTIVDTGSYTRAADTLDLTQSAGSSQIARLSQLFGGSIFAKGQGLTLTPRGLVILQYARRMLAMNDELLATAATNSVSRQLNIGLPSWMSYRQLSNVFERCSATPINLQVSFRCDRVERLVADLNLGSLDIAYVCNVSALPRVTVAQYSEEMFWVKSPRLVLGAGAPIPLVSWPGTYPDRLALEALEQNKMSFFVAFSAPELSARSAAVAAGLGVMVSSLRNMTPEMEIVRDGLPKLPINKTGLFAREGLDLGPLAPLLRMLTKELEPGRLAARTNHSAKTAAFRRPGSRSRSGMRDEFI